MARQQVVDRTAPKPHRPHMPGYGISKGRKGLLQWPEVVEQLEKSRNYWICTTRPDGRPHAAPVWGVWLDGALLFGTGAGTVKGRNVAANPYVVAHLESGDDAVMLEGTAEQITDPDLLDSFDEAYDAKYGIRPVKETPTGHYYVLRPTVAFAWREQDFGKSATRFRFDQ